MFGMLMAQEILGWICEFGVYQAIVQAVLTGLASQNECDNVCDVINAERRLTVRRKMRISKLTLHNVHVLVNRLYINRLEKCMICWVLNS